ncbi:MBL fold metallo-hydrolase [Egicoccus sp. AB-alg2]|uniref:MBL fold metallo-hydrolase n=1 Tax=Egicoccus sp. AB-alg2 TaxID=3242693 RepID=UPI00359CCD88
MDPFLGDPFAVGRDLHVVPTYWPVPNAGILPMNAFLLHAAEPVLVDTGAGILGDDFVDAVASVLPLERLRWIWLTHEDRDHTGSLLRLLELAPQARLISNFFAVGRMLPETPIPLDRLHVVNAGDRVHVGDRELTAIRPPLFDSPATTGFLDAATGTLVASDCFGGPLPSLEEATAHSTMGLDPEVVAQGQLAWASVDMPWVTSVDEQVFARDLDAVRRMQPTTVLSSHLPPVIGRTEELLQTMRRAPRAEPVPGPTQAELEALLATFEPGAA